MTDNNDAPETTPKPRKRRVTQPAKKEAVKELTISEFQSYIKGAIELNQDDWHPDSAQWAKIAEMILNIKPDEPVVQTVVNPQPAYRDPNSSGHPPANVQRGPSMMSNNEGEQNYERLPERQRAPAIDASANPAARPVVEQTGAAGQKDENGAVSSGIRVKTPNVDTSEQPYQSGFQ